MYKGTYIFPLALGSNMTWHSIVGTHLYLNFCYSAHQSSCINLIFKNIALNFVLEVSAFL